MDAFLSDPGLPGWLALFVLAAIVIVVAGTALAKAGDGIANVTGDRKDFGHLFEQEIHGVNVITPLRLAELLDRPG